MALKLPIIPFNKGKRAEFFLETQETIIYRLLTTDYLPIIYRLVKHGWRVWGLKKLGPEPPFKLWKDSLFRVFLRN